MMTIMLLSAPIHAGLKGRSAACPCADPGSNGNGSGSDGWDCETWENALTVNCKAGDMIIMPLRLVHAAKVWKPTGRDRRMMFYTFAPQDVMASEGGSIADEIPLAEAVGIVLDDETKELASMKEKGLSQQFKPMVKKMIDDGLLEQAVDRARTLHY
jgi:hypothetical protein